MQQLIQLGNNSKVIFALGFLHGISDGEEHECNRTDQHNRCSIITHPISYTLTGVLYGIGTSFVTGLIPKKIRFLASGIMLTCLVIRSGHLLFRVNSNPKSKLNPETYCTKVKSTMTIEEIDEESSDEEN